MRKLILMFIVLPILLMAAPNQAIDTDAWTNLWVYPMKFHGIEYIDSREGICLFRSLDIASAGTTMIREPIFVAPHNVFSLRIPLHAESLRTEYQLGADSTHISNYGDWNWLVDTTNTGPDSTYSRALGGKQAFALGQYLWWRFINLQSAVRTDIPVFFSGKEQ